MTTTDEIATNSNEADEEFYTVLDRRSKSIADGTALMYTWEETKKAAQNSKIVSANK